MDRPASSFMRAVSVLMSGTVAAQVLVYAARPLLTRLFTPEAFGLWGVYVAVIALLNTASTLRYEDAILLPEREDEARVLLGCSVLILCVFSLITVGMAPWKTHIAALLNEPELAPFIPLVPAGVLAIGWMRLGEIWLTRIQRFRSMTYGSS